jgi:hypothetical protein
MDTGRGQLAHLAAGLGAGTPGQYHLDIHMQECWSLVGPVREWVGDRSPLCFSVWR